ncbi:MAG: formate/nitrite transporter family protein [Clostridiales bacterium]|nr:formate/nitrite transporter family protein [Candidatus Crickella caballi]
MNTPSEIVSNYMTIGKGKCALPTWKLLVLGILAGLFIGLAGLGATTAAVSISLASVSKLVGACIFPAGLIMVVIAGSELFTGNCLLVIPLLEGEIKAAAMLRNWMFVYIGNFIGSIAVAAGAVYSHQLSLFGGAMSTAVISTAVAKCSMTFGEALLKGVFCNILVCIAVWLGMAAKEVSGKILGIFWPIMLFVLCGFEHSVANMYYIGAGLFALGNPDYLAAAGAAGIETSALTWCNFFTANLLPVTIGNIIGGGVVAAAYWACYRKK